MTAQPIPLKTRRAVHERSGGVCEVCGSARAIHVHHRQLRSQGGTNDATNLLDCCAHCHTAIHASPERSYDRGWLVRATDDPALVPVAAPDPFGEAS